jgi:hypothetical protein
LGSCPCSKCVRLRNRATDDSDRQFFVRRTEPRAEPRPGYHGWSWASAHWSGAVVARGESRRCIRCTPVAATRD